MTISKEMGRAFNFTLDEVKNVDTNGSCHDIITQLKVGDVIKITCVDVSLTDMPDEPLQMTRSVSTYSKKSMPSITTTYVVKNIDAENKLFDAKGIRVLTLTPLTFNKKQYLKCMGNVFEGTLIHETSMHNILMDNTVDINQLYDDVDPSEELTVTQPEEYFCSWFLCTDGTKREVEALGILEENVTVEIMEAAKTEEVVQMMDIVDTLEIV
jgi:hypothetical protein